MAYLHGAAHHVPSQEAQEARGQGYPMTYYEIITIALTVIGVLLIPLIVVAFRGLVRWIRTESKLDKLVDDVRELVTDQEKVHREMIDQMKYDRDATNTRLQYLERYFMSRGMGRNALQGRKTRRKLGCQKYRD